MGTKVACREIEVGNNENTFISTIDPGFIGYIPSTNMQKKIHFIIHWEKSCCAACRQAASPA
jgi:hypothetical protein